jgi:DNA-directed RNA polymerase beta' subunit
VLSKIPVTPPVIRPILPLKDGRLQVGDANLLYKDAFLANDQLRSAVRHPALVRDCMRRGSISMTPSARCSASETR